MKQRAITIEYDEDEGRHEVVKRFWGDDLCGGHRERMLLNQGLSATPRLFRSTLADGVLTLHVEYIAGQPLSDVNFVSAPIPEKLGIAASVATAVAEVHRHGLRVGDLSEENIILRGKRSYLVDLSYRHDPRLGPETKARYIAPEMSQDYPLKNGKKSMVGRATDVYNLGQMLKSWDPNLFASIIKQCTLYETELRPTANEVLKLIDGLSNPRKKWIWSSCLTSVVMFLAGMIGPWSLGPTSPQDQIVTMLNVNSGQDGLWKARRLTATLSEADRLKCAEAMSPFSGAPTPLNSSAVLAVYALAVPMVRLRTGRIGTGSKVETPSGQQGVLVGVKTIPRPELIIFGEDGIFSWPIGLPEKIGFQTFGDPNPALLRIIIMPDGNNLEEVLEDISLAIGIPSPPQTDGVVLGKYSSDSWENFATEIGGYCGFDLEENQIAFTSCEFRVSAPITAHQWQPGMADLGSMLGLEMVNNSAIGIGQMVSIQTNLGDVIKSMSLRVSLDSDRLTVTRELRLADQNEGDADGLKK